MMPLSFDNMNTKGPTTADVLKELTKKTTSDRIECGENNEHWVYVRHSTKEVELVSKVTGLVEFKCAVKDAAFKFKQLTPAQLSVITAGVTP